MPPNHHHHHDILIPSNSNFNSDRTTTQQPSPPPPKPSPKFLSLLLKAIVMVVIISLFFLFLGIATVAFIHFFLAGGALHRHRRRRRSTTTTSSAYSAEDLKRCLPMLKYTSGFPGKDCAVCLEYFKEGEWCRSLPECNHMFHVSCVDKWLTKVPNCPICRARVRLHSEATGSVIGEDCKLLWAVRV